MWYVYIIRNNTNGRFYIGSTNNVERRIAEHNRSKKRSVTHFGQYYFIYSEKYANRSEAYQREMQIKAYKGGNSFKKLLREKVGIVV